MNLFKMSRELQSEVCNHYKPHASSCTRETLFQGRKGSPEGTVKKQSVSFHGLSPWQERKGVFLLSVALLPSQVMRTPHSGLSILFEVSVYCGSAGKESTCNTGDLGLIPGLGRSPGERKGYPPQYSGLENSLERIVHGVAMSWTQLSDFHFHFCLLIFIIAFPYYSFNVCKVSSDISCFILDINLCLLLFLSRNKTRSLLVLL